MHGVVIFLEMFIKIRSSPLLSPSPISQAPDGEHPGVTGATVSGAGVRAGVSECGSQTLSLPHLVAGRHATHQRNNLGESYATINPIHLPY